MVAFLTGLLQGPFAWSARRTGLEAENLLLRQQLIVLRRKHPGRVRLRNLDPLDVGLALPTVSGTVGRHPSSAAGDSAALASSWFPGLLALAFAQPRWPFQNRP